MDFISLLKEACMNLSNISMYLGALLTLLAFCVAIGYRYYNPMATDNDPIEKVCEEIIEKETGIDISIKDKK
jgi:hypothetical protein